MSTPFEAGFEAEVRQGSNVLEAAKAAGVGHLVYSSVASADRDTGIPQFETKAELERRLGGLGLARTVLAPVEFKRPLERVRGFGEDATLTSEWLDAVGYSVDIEALRCDCPEVGWRTFEDWSGLMGARVFRGREVGPAGRGA